MGKVDTIILHPDMTFEEKKKKTESTEIDLGNDYKPSFKIGRSVFKEINVSRLKFWRKPRNLIILLFGAHQAFELHDGKTQEIEPNYWSMKEKQKFIKKLIAKSKAAQRAISLSHFIILAILLVVIIVLQLALMRGIRIV